MSSVKILWVFPLLLPHQVADLNHDGCTDLADFSAFQAAFEGPTCSGDELVEMVLVPGGGAGPEYDFYIGKHEITNEQFARFLNDAQADGGVTRRGSSMVFAIDGAVRTISGAILFRARNDQYPEARIQYVRGAALGDRYFVQSGFEEHPATGMSWIGALKYANWMTEAAGLNGQYCYTEGSSAFDWHPIGVTTGAWIERDLNDEERRNIVESCRGYRLLMDGGGSRVGAGLETFDFNEWYKAASFDPSAPSFERFGPSGEFVPARHWAYGFGRDTLSPGDANFAGSADPLEPGTTPVGYFNGDNWLAWSTSRTNANNNFFGVYDVSGNVAEFVQDQIFRPESGFVLALRGGSWGASLLQLSTSYRAWTHIETRGADIGFRVLRVPEQDFSKIFQD